MYRLENVSMLHMLKVLEYGYGISVSQFSYLEFYDSPVKFPYCLFFRIVGIPDTHSLRLARESTERGFFASDITIASETIRGSLVDSKLLDVSFFQKCSSLFELVEEESDGR